MWTLGYSGTKVYKLVPTTINYLLEVFIKLKRIFLSLPMYLYILVSIILVQIQFLSGVIFLFPEGLSLTFLLFEVY